MPITPFALLILTMATDPSPTFDGLDLSGPAPDTKPAPPAVEPQGLALDGVDLTTTPTDRAPLERALALFASGQPAPATVAAWELLQEATLTDLHPEARLLLARALGAMNLVEGALDSIERLLAMGPGPSFEAGRMLGFDLATRPGQEERVLERLAPWLGTPLAGDAPQAARYLLARYHFARGRALLAADRDAARASLEEAKRIALEIPQGDPLHPKARYLIATILFEAGTFEEALDSFKEVVRATNPKVHRDADTRLRAQALMQLARTHYGHRQNRNAIFYYDRIPQGAQPWLDSVLEASWAHYRIGEYEQALGNLITLSSPFFKDAWLPEAQILKAIIYYENCRYRDAKEILGAFEKTYVPEQAQLEKLLATEDELWSWLAEHRRTRLGRLALADARLQRVDRALVSLDDQQRLLEKASPAFRETPLAKHLIDGVDRERDRLRAQADGWVREKLERELAQLKALLGQALRIGFETTTQEKESLEATLGASGKPNALYQYGFSVAVPDSKLYWPFEGEYWRDELGTYQYTLTQGCKPMR